MRPAASLGLRLVQSHITATLIVLIIASLVSWAALVSEAQRYEALRREQFENLVLTLLQETNDPPRYLLSRLRGALTSVDVQLHFDNPVPFQGSEPQAVRLIGGPSPASGQTLQGIGWPSPAHWATWHEGTLVALYYRFDYGVAYFQFTPTTPVKYHTEQVLAHFVTILAVGIVGALLLSWWLGQRVSRPLVQLAFATRALADGDFGQRLRHTGVEELDAVASRFNHMAGQLEESFRQLRQERDQARRFAGDAAHELKTPLTALKTYAEVAQTATDGRREQAAAAVLRQVGRLEHLVGGLTQLAALHEGEAARLEPDDLRAATVPLLPSCLEMAAKAGHRFHDELTDTALPVRLERRLLELILTNLAENACKFTSPGGQITLSLGAAGQEAFLAVADTGPGILADELPHIFDRFHRGLSTQRIPGSGLGLSIVAKAAERLGGRVEVYSREGEGSRFTVYLPLVG